MIRSYSTHRKTIQTPGKLEAGTPAEGVDGVELPQAVGNGEERKVDTEEI